MRLELARPHQLPLIYELVVREPLFWHSNTALLSQEAFIANDIIWFLVYGESKELMALVSFGSIDAINRCASIGLIVMPDFRGGLTAIRAHKLIVEMAFSTMGLHRIVAGVLRSNEVTWKGLQHVGWSLCGHFKDAQRIGNRWEDRLVYELISKDS